MRIMSAVIQRLLEKPTRSFFLFGPRGTGKSTWLKQQMPAAIWFDLLDTSLQLELLETPHHLEALIGRQPEKTWIVLDEVQKIPALLDEVHRLIEKYHWHFALCGSSARKLKRQGANLLAGRALTLDMEPFCSAELADAFDLEYALNWGLLPVLWDDQDQAADILSAYIDTYLKEEIRMEGVIRKLPPFIRFLTIAGQINGQVINLQNIARDAAAPRSTVEGYFSVLTDTLLGHYLPAYRPGLKVREATHPKFFWIDNGIARAAAGLLRDPIESTYKGAALETLLFHELRTYNTVKKKHRPISYYRTASGLEIDFVVETQKRQMNEPAHIVCIEVKYATKWQRKWERILRDVQNQNDIKVERMIGVYTGTRSYHFDGLDVLPVTEFLDQLYNGLIF